MARNPSTFLEDMIWESDAYLSLDRIESLVEAGDGLHNLPVQPLYLAIKKLSADQAAGHLPKLSKEQRGFFLDLDLWEKDHLSVHEFEYWVQAYSFCLDDEVRNSFVQSTEFGLYLRGRFNIKVFDEEDPQYPDHDNYFLTEDHLLLFEFGEDDQISPNVQRLLRDLYSQLGTELAYAHIFKYISETFFPLQEEEYQLKKERLREIGFVDYYEALEIGHPFSDFNLMNHFICRKKERTPSLDEFNKLQRLDYMSLISYKKGLEPIYDELKKVKHLERKDFLQFNFIRLVNGSIALEGGLEEGSVALNRIGQKTLALLELGYDYLKEGQKKGEFHFETGRSLFDYFDFCEVYKIGNTLIRLPQKRLKKSLRESSFGEARDFLGDRINRFLDLSFKGPVQWEDDKRQELVIKDYKTWKKFDSQVLFLENLLPFAGEIFKMMNKLIQSGHLQDHFYLNYDVSQLDLESIILSHFANFLLGHYKEEEQAIAKLGLTLDEYKRFLDKTLDFERGHVRSEIREEIKKFQKKFSWGSVPSFLKYFELILREHLEGYTSRPTKDEDYQYWGGPILLDTLGVKKK